VKYRAQSVCGAYCCHAFANLLLHIFLLHCLLFFFLLLSFELLIIIDLCYNFLDDKVGSAKSTTPKDKTYSKSTLVFSVLVGKFTCVLSWCLSCFEAKNLNGAFLFWSYSAILIKLHSYFLCYFLITVLFLKVILVVGVCNFFSHFPL
jgi:hypothetical protein